MSQRARHRPRIQLARPVIARCHRHLSPGPESARNNFPFPPINSGDDALSPLAPLSGFSGR